MDRTFCCIQPRDGKQTTHESCHDDETYKVDPGRLVGHGQVGRPTKRSGGIVAATGQDLQVLNQTTGLGQELPRIDALDRGGSTAYGEKACSARDKECCTI
jgi:hypothetical protein